MSYSSSYNSDKTALGNKNFTNPAKGANSAVELVDDNEMESRPLSSWRVWYRNRRPSMNSHSIRTLSTKLEKPEKQDTTDAVENSGAGNKELVTAVSWWRRGSFTSLKGMSRRYSDVSNKTTLESFVETAPQDQEASPSPYEIAVKDVQKPKKRAWPLWNKSSPALTGEEGIEHPPQHRLRKPVTNEVIVSNRDAILFKRAPSKDTDEDQKSRNSCNIGFRRSHLLVPNFEILPKYTTFSFLYSSMGNLVHKWNLISESQFKSRTLYRRSPDTTINALSSGKTKPLKVLLIGVHGFFPTKMLRPLIGEPTGTSTKFITEAEKTVNRWFRAHKTPVEISKIALEKEGKIFERVDFFFEVMRKWANELNEAGFVYFVSHSQGCPVTVILLARLIEAGIINLNTPYVNPDLPVELAASKQRKVISILAMAGINNGPFHGVDQTFLVKAYSAIENDSLQELFQFQDFNTLQSKKYIQSLRIVIASNVKITFVGSINDQLVPLYSSTCLFAHHPNIFRATFIDKDSRTPAFISRIVKIAHHLMNLGYDDHNIIKEISASLAGSLTCGGHSKVYNEDQVYELGIRFALETTDLPIDTPVTYKPYQVNQLGSNPYHLPWCMRGLLYETDLHLDKEEIIKLFYEFDEWEPETKQLKDVKYRLNGLKSKL